MVPRREIIIIDVCTINNNLSYWVILYDILNCTSQEVNDSVLYDIDDCKLYIVVEEGGYTVYYFIMKLPFSTIKALQH